MRTIILALILAVTIAIAGEFIAAQEIKASEPYVYEQYMGPLDTGGHGNQVSAAYPLYYEGEIHIIVAWVVIDEPVEGYPSELVFDHYHIIPIHLVSKDKLFEVCERPGKVLPHGTVACFNNWYIYIINGYQGAIPTNGGCSILYHELLHVEGLLDLDIEYQYPNNRCSVRR